MSFLLHDRKDANGITCADAPDATWVTLWGEVDAALREQASEAMVFLMSRDRPVVLDVGAVTFIDSSGLAFLVQVHRVCNESAIDLELLDPSSSLLELLDMLGIAGQFVVRRSATAGAGVDGASTAS